jgi:AraC family transcriptional activator of pobA
LNTAASDLPMTVPDVDFYGREETWPTSERLHSEPLVERSAVHDWTISAHRHQHLTQLFLLLEGSGVARLDSVRHEVTAPALIVIPENVVHEFEWSKNSSGYVLSITSSLAAKLRRKISRYAVVYSNPASYSLHDAGESFGSLLKQIHDEYSGDAPLRELSLETLLIEMSVELARLVGKETDTHRAPGRSGRHFRSFVALLDQHHKSQWSVARYAAVLGITAPHLNTLCKRYSGQSAKRMINHRLTLAARRALAYTDNNVSSIARDLGFADPAYFSRFFRRAEGVTPSEFRRQTGTRSAAVR